MTKKGKFLQKLNDAFAKSDIDFIADNVTDDIQWTMHGDFSIRGRTDFIDMLKKMEGEEPYELEISNIITHGDSAAVDGTIKMSGNGSTYAFCDVYKLRGFKNPKIKAMTSYVVEVT